MTDRTRVVTSNRGEFFRIRDFHVCVLCLKGPIALREVLKREAVKETEFRAARQKHEEEAKQR